MNSIEKAKYVYSILKNMDIMKDTRFTSIEGLRNGDIFKAFVATILSQNTSDKNSIAAFRELNTKFVVTPVEICRTETSRIKEAIVKAGLYNSKAEAIKQSAKFIMSKLDGDLNNLKRYPLSQARRMLSSIRGIGLKTADVILLHMGYPVFPVDTHIKRVSRRIGLVDARADYEDISEIWKKALKPVEYLDAHLRLIAFGRKVCKARKPRCNICPLSNICIYVKKHG